MELDQIPRSGGRQIIGMALESPASNHCHQTNYWNGIVDQALVLEPTSTMCPQLGIWKGLLLMRFGQCPEENIKFRRRFSAIREILLSKLDGQSAFAQLTGVSSLVKLQALAMQQISRNT